MTKMEHVIFISSIIALIMVLATYTYHPEVHFLDESVTMYGE